jgi:hypothetical protein
MIGYTYVDVGSQNDCFLGYCVSSGGGSGNYFDMQLGFEGKLMLADRAFVFFRPLTLDFGTDGNAFVFRWDIMAGGGVTF